MSEGKEAKHGADGGDALDARLARLARETEAIAPRAGFAERVMFAVHAEAMLPWWSSVSKSARRIVPMALLVAVAAVSWAVVNDRDADQASAESYAAMDLEW